MEQLTKVVQQTFDNFTIVTRIRPAIIVAFPLLIITFYNSTIKCNWTEAGIGITLSLAVISFAAYIVRELGKTYEEKFYKNLGGMPTTISLRFSDDTIDIVTKTKYHKWINEKIPDLNLPISKEEEDINPHCNEKYESAVKYLRAHANSEREKFPMVYRELKKYNFWRNLYGCKWGALLLYIFLIIREILTINHFSLFEMFLNPFPKYPMLIMLFVWCGLFCLLLTQKTVKRNAFDYAKALLETINVYIDIN